MQFANQATLPFDEIGSRCDLARFDRTSSGVGRQDVVRSVHWSGCALYITQ
jgi:hypothetical protein